MRALDGSLGIEVFSVCGTRHGLRVAVALGRKRGSRGSSGARLIVNNGGSGHDELNLSETGHDLTINWDTTTMTIHSVSHGWGAGYAQCVAGTAPCDPAKIAIDVAGHTVTFTSLALVDDPFSMGSTCTIDGVARW